MAQFMFTIPSAQQFTVDASGMAHTSGADAVFISQSSQADNLQRQQQEVMSLQAQGYYDNPPREVSSFVSQAHFAPQTVTQDTIYQWMSQWQSE